MSLRARGNLTRDTVSAMSDEMDWRGSLFEEKWRAGKQSREHHVEELRLLRELVEMDRSLNRKDGRLRLGAECWRVGGSACRRTSSGEPSGR